MRDNGSIKQTEVKNIAIAQRVMGYEKKTTMKTNIFVGQFSGFIAQKQNKTRVMINLTVIPEARITT